MCLSPILFLKQWTVLTQLAPATGSASMGLASARRAGRARTAQPWMRTPGSACLTAPPTASSTWRASSAFARKAGLVRTAQADFAISTAENMEGKEHCQQRLT